MKQYELQAFVQSISNTHFNKPFKHLAIFNQRLRTTGGRYHLETHDLDFNPKILELFGKEVFTGIVKHELCHYHLHLEGKGYKHADAEFKELLRNVQGLRYTPSIESQQETVIRWVYTCQECSTHVYRKRRFNVRKFVCAQCKGILKLEGQKILKTFKI